MLAVLLTLATAAGVGLTAQTAQVSLQGRPQALYAADVTGDGNLDGVAVVAIGDARRVVVLDAMSGDRDGGPLAPTLLEIPDDATFFGACPAIGAGLVLGRSDGVDLLGLDGSLKRLADLPDALPFVERGDLPLIELCLAALPQPVAVPTLRGIALVGGSGPPRDLRPPRRAYLTSGVGFRGPRARRDFTLMTTLLTPRLFAGEIDGDGTPDLAAAIEEELQLTLASGKERRRLLPVRSQRARDGGEGDVETQLAELTGDGILDAVVSHRVGGSSQMKTVWVVFAGPLTAGGKPRAIARVHRKGLATPLLVVDADLDGLADVVEPLVDTGIISMGQALITGEIAVDYRVHRFIGGHHQESRSLEIAHDIDFGRTTNIAGHPPLLGADLDGDGRGDFLSLGAAAQVALHLGRAGDPPFSRRAAVTANVPTTQRAVLLRRDRNGPPMLLFLDELEGRARVTSVVFRQSAGRRAPGAPLEGRGR